MPYINEDLNEKFSESTEHKSRTKKVVAHKTTTKKTKPIRKVVVIIVVCVVLGIVIFWNQLTDWYVIATGNPTIVKLAQEADMTTRGEVLFLQMDPELVSDSDMETDCSSNAAANNSNGFIEQGCYIPNQNDPTTGKIYLREMPSDYHNLEVVTAAYELLHPVYASLVQSGQETPLNASIESNFKSNEDSNLDTQVANFAKTEPQARDDELFSLLGTEYPGISSDLLSYYSPYFGDSLETVSTLNSQIFTAYNNDQSQLTQLQTTITNDDNTANQALSDANTAYYDSTTWADVGNQAEDTRNYDIYVQDFNIYKNDIADENDTIDQYNALIDKTNTLITEYTGTQPVNQAQGVQAQQSQ
jgi:hypothetical protein